jgi:uncharacterized protein (TIGR02145 family)
MKLFNRQGWGRALLLAAALTVAWLSGCSITTGNPDNAGGSNTGVNVHTHTWGDWTVLTPATCGAQGVEMRTCTQDASHKDVRTIPQLTGTWCNSTGGAGHVHTWGDWTMTTPATCVAQGAETRTCTQDASHTEVRTTPQLTGAECNPTSGGEHVHTWGEWAVTLWPTCDEPGMETRLCTQDPSHKDKMGIPQLTGAACDSTGGWGGDHVHTWGAWVVTTPATCSASGVETRTCTQDAGHRESRGIAQLSGAACNSGGSGDHVHTWGAWVVTIPATCSSSGVETRTCTQDASHRESRGIAQLTGAACNSGGGGGINNCTSAESCRSAVMPDGRRWLTENLNVETANSWCYNNSLDNCNKYGRLYTWAAATSACQFVGMRLPSEEEWEALETATGVASIGMAGKKLKATSGWGSNASSYNGTDDFGFSALPGGARDDLSLFKYVGQIGCWWTATELSSGSNKVYYWYMRYNDVNVYVSNTYKNNIGLSARCIMDE